METVILVTIVKNTQVVLFHIILEIKGSCELMCSNESIKADSLQGSIPKKLYILLTLFHSWELFRVYRTYSSVLGIMYTQVKRHFAEDLNVRPVVIARLSNFTVFCMVCNNTLQVSSIRYRLNGNVCWFTIAQELTQVCTHTERRLWTS